MIDLEKMINMPGYDLLGSYEAGLPVYKVNLRVRVRKKQSLSALSEFTLKLISLGVDSEKNISKALGLDSTFIESSLEQLNALQLIKAQIDPSQPIPVMQFSISAKGKEALNKTLMSSFDTLLPIQVDGLTGRYSAGNKDSRYWEGSELRKNGVFLLHGSTKARPSVEFLNADIHNLVSIFKNHQDDLGNSDQLIEVLEVLKSRLNFKVVNVLVFWNKQEEQIKLRVFEGYEPCPEYDNKLAERERNGSRVIPDDFLTPQSEFTPSNLTKDLKIDLSKLRREEAEFEKLFQEKELLSALTVEDEQPDSDIVTTRTKRIQELELALSELEKKQSSTRLLKASEHYMMLKKSLSQSRQYVLIISPWIKRNVVDEDMIRLIKDALERDVWVLIGYGMPLRPGEVKEDYIDGWVSNQFQIIQRQQKKNKLYYYYLETHEKILVCDDIFSVVTSLNWLSYRGDKGIRRETGTYTEDPKIVSDTIKVVLSGFKTLPEGFPINKS